MFSCTKSVLAYGLFGLVLLFLMLYVWRRIYGLECYTQILEKKLANLKKENKQLQTLHNKPLMQEEADIIMNKIFADSDVDISFVADDVTVVYPSQKLMQPSQSVPSASSVPSVPPSTLTVPSEPSTFAVPPVPPVPPVSPVLQTKLDDTDAILKNIIEGSISGLEGLDTETTDMESVISDMASSATYNKKKLSKMNLDKLKDICTEMQLSTEGTKNMLIDRILGQ